MAVLVHQTAVHNSHDEAHAGSTVSLVRLIFTVLHLGFSCFHNPVICGLQTEKHTKRIGMSACANRWWKAIALSEVPLCLCCRQTHMSNSTQLIKVCAHWSVRGKNRGRCFVILNFSFASHRSSPQIYTTANSVECFCVSPVLTHTVGEKYNDSIWQLCQMMKLLLESGNRI